MHLAQDFIYAATAYGKIIISEYYLPYKQKTIKPVALGGLMGGQKYVVHNILFKFAVDNRGLFGSDYAAAKVAGNELRGLISYFNCRIEDLNVPLMALVDYRGFRLIAMSILPIGDETIVYGSCDAGRNIHAANAKLNELMAKAAEMMNLKPHYCRIAKPKADSKTNQPHENKIIFNMPAKPPIMIKSNNSYKNEESNHIHTIPTIQIEEPDNIQLSNNNNTDVNLKIKKGTDGKNQKQKKKKQGLSPQLNIQPSAYDVTLKSLDTEEEDRMELLYSPADLD
jgi:hypothetical protein